MKTRNLISVVMVLCFCMSRNLFSAKNSTKENKTIKVKKKVKKVTIKSPPPPKLLDAKAIIELQETQGSLTMICKILNEITRVKGSRKLGECPITFSVVTKLLIDEDPFIRGLAWRALSMSPKIKSVLEEATVSEWGEKWKELAENNSIEIDYVRQAFEHGLHNDSNALLETVSKIIQQAKSVIKEINKKTILSKKNQTIDVQLEKLETIYNQLENSVQTDIKNLQAHRNFYLDARNTARNIVLSNPSLNFKEILFFKRHASGAAKNITRSFPWKHNPGGDICIISNWRTKPKLRNVIQNQLGPGYVFGMELHWDGKKVVFAYTKQPNGILSGSIYTKLRTMEPTHIFEISLDGSNLKQLTNDSLWSDFEPTYCANDDIVFSSDRKGNGAECGNWKNDISNPNLYIMNSDGKNVRQFTDAKDLDRYPHCLDNGLIVYTHWEYQERSATGIHALWTIRPDGTMSDAFFNQHRKMYFPTSLRDARSIPNTSKLVAIAVGHHSFAEGAIVIVDPRYGINNDKG